MAMFCISCGASDPKTFYVSVKNCCKECHKKRIRENRQKNVEYYRAYDAHRFQNDPKVKERLFRYQETDAGKSSMARAKAKWIATHPEERSAQNALNNAIRDGKIKKPSHCSVCGKGGRIHGHHDDYTRPLDVVWCCSPCHKNIHHQLESQTESKGGGRDATP